MDYRTEDGTANAGSDYEFAEGTLLFKPGETLKGNDRSDMNIHDMFSKAASLRRLLSHLQPCRPTACSVYCVESAKQTGPVYIQLYAISLHHIQSQIIPVSFNKIQVRFRSSWKKQQFLTQSKQACGDSGEEPFLPNSIKIPENQGVLSTASVSKCFDGLAKMKKVSYFY